MATIRHIEEYAYSQRERLYFIDFRIRFLGQINRSEIIKRFDVKEAAATRDLSLYRTLAPSNVSLNGRIKSYFRTPKYQPLFEHETSYVLRALAEGLGDNSPGRLASYLRSERIGPIAEPDLNDVSVISRAITFSCLAEVTHLCPDSGPIRIEIAPFALIDAGSDWRIRAFDRGCRRFRNLSLLRLRDAKIDTRSAELEETRESDDQWQRVVELEIAAHPGVAHPESIERALGMQDGVLHLRLRAPLVADALTAWGIDPTPDHNRDPRRHTLWLRNPPALYGVEGVRDLTSA